MILGGSVFLMSEVALHVGQDPTDTQKANDSLINVCKSCCQIGMGGVPREQKLLKGHLPGVICHQV